VRERESVCVRVRECVYVYSQTWCSVRLLDFSGGWDEALETHSVFPTYALQSVKETLCTTRNQASINVDWMSTMSSLQEI
jgi:hypothetical protein